MAYEGQEGVGHVIESKWFRTSDSNSGLPTRFYVVLKLKISSELEQWN